MSSPIEREKNDRRDSRGDERDGQGRKRNRNESEEREEIKTFPSPPPHTTITCYKDNRPCPIMSKYQLDARGRKIYDNFTTLDHPAYDIK